ncbi:hypothetical protein GCM10018954_037180 [Kutzneria kofuensis]
MAGCGGRGRTHSGDGHRSNKAYEVFVTPGIGYRYDNGCCFDYGNVETTNNDDGNGTMEAIHFGNASYWDTGAGSGPWIMADLENGLLSGSDVNSPNPGGSTINRRYTTTMIEGGSNQWAILPLPRRERRLHRRRRSRPALGLQRPAQPAVAPRLTPAESNHE